MNGNPDTTEIRIAPEDCRIVFTRSKEGEGFVGVTVNGQRILKADLPPAFNVYMNQISAKYGKKVYIVDNIFKFCGLI